MISKYYFINKFDTNNIDKQDKQTIIVYRDYVSRSKDQRLILKIKNYCKKKSIKFYLSNNIKLSIRLKLDGAYLPSFNKYFAHLSYPLRRNFILIGSAHSLKEIRTKENQNVEEIFISSIFKINKNYLGINRFKLLSKVSSRDIIALGGISMRNLKLLSLTKSIGFAGISIFK